MYRFFIFFFLILVNPNVSSQKELTFNSGEEVSFDVYYNWGFIWLHAGKAMFSATDTMYNNLPAYKFNATGISFNGYDRFFKVRDTLNSIVSADSLKPYWFSRSTNEGTYSARFIYNFDYQKRLVYGEKIRKHKTNKAIIALPENTKDMLSVIYYLRDIDFKNYRKNDRIKFNMVVDNELWELYVRYLGKETIELKTGKKFRCLVLSPLLLEGSVFSGGEGMKIYITDDRNRLPVYIETKVSVGKVKANIESYKNLKFPLTSEVM